MPASRLPPGPLVASSGSNRRLDAVSRLVRSPRPCSISCSPPSSCRFLLHSSIRGGGFCTRLVAWLRRAFRLRRARRRRRGPGFSVSAMLCAAPFSRTPLCVQVFTTALVTFHHTVILLAAILRGSSSGAGGCAVFAMDTRPRASTRAFFFNRPPRSFRRPVVSLSDRLPPRSRPKRNGCFSRRALLSPREYGL